MATKVVSAKLSKRSFCRNKKNSLGQADLWKLLTRAYFSHPGCPVEGFISIQSSLTRPSCASFILLQSIFPRLGSPVEAFAVMKIFSARLPCGSFCRHENFLDQTVQWKLLP